MKILIKNGHVIDPANDIDKKMDILVENGTIKNIKEHIENKEADIIDAEGKIVSPGFVDLHTHLREPGREDKETLDTGLQAAVKGGYTTVSAMPNTDPPCDRQAQVKYLKERALEIKLANVLPIGTITKGREGKELSEMGELKRAGVLAVTDDGDSVESSVLMRKACEYAKMFDLLIMSHAEDASLAASGVMNEGYWSTALGLAPIPAEAESVIVDRDIRLALMAGTRLHISHISAKESVEIVRNAKKKSSLITAEVTPHHFTLKDEDLKNYNTNLKVNPPLRTAEDIKEIKKALKEGVIDAIATDHAPHTENEKEKEFDYAPFGMIGLETALALSIKELIKGGVFGWVELIRKMALNPARIIGIDKGTLTIGKEADITIIDPDKEWEYKKEDILSLSKNSPFIGWTFTGMVTDVMVRGRRVLTGGKIKA